MSINLTKGQKIDLSKGKPNLSKLMVGLGWDPVQKKAGLLGSLFGGGGANIDCDASAILLDKSGKMKGKSNLIYYGNLKNDNRSVVHQGDNLTGDGDGDDEQILLDLANVPTEIDKIVFVVNIYDCATRKQDFGMIQNAFIRIVDMNNSNEMCKYRLSEDYAGKTSLVVGEIYRDAADWKFGAIGQGTNHNSLSELIKQYT
ncbi:MULTISPECIES: TerD family protein [unclassified Fusibacter]|uniref:TerD family protein n=1 Tax=unclassified Fusibacter TaxID=2624464 RepID=UPI00101056C3|nr:MULTISPECIES: TerD family protein [unclassified Fusibacter]MCK8058240.1 TerD family protein [Fusibacter sp. A2]NPE20823.1 TerD family protein [Fusibacter sp. A1]RXV63027.1 TerD family protein [Fusibacter sp. A1]